MRIAGCILAGGRSTRFGSDKALALLEGKTLLDHAIARLAPQVRDLAINTNSADAAFSQTGLPLLADQTQDFRGPLDGILAALIWALSIKADAVVTAAVDTPLFPTDLVRKLSAGHADTIAAAQSASGLHPTFALWPAGVEPALSRWLSSGKSLRVTDFLGAQTFTKIAFDAPGGLDPFFNINFEDQRLIVEAQMRNRLTSKA